MLEKKCDVNNIITKKDDQKNTKDDKNKSFLIMCIIILGLITSISTIFHQDQTILIAFNTIMNQNQTLPSH